MNTKNSFSTAAACLLMGAATGYSQGPPADTPFHAKGDRGETVHVLPTPDGAAHSAARGGPQPLFSKTTSTPKVYPASYGSGNLINHGGLEISGAAFFAVYWNTAVSNSVSGQIATFVGSFGNSANGDYSAAKNTGDYAIVQQYGSISSSLPYLGSFVDTTHDGKPTPTSISDSDIQKWLAGLIPSFPNSSNTPLASIIYALYFPGGMTVTLGNSSSCSNFCGYHSVFTYGSTQIKYAVFPYPNCSGCTLSGLTAGDMLTIVGSHEIREAVTDPGDFGQNAWYDKVGYEADDKCAWHNLYQMVNGGFWVQPEYSNGGTFVGISYPGSGCVVP